MPPNLSPETLPLDPHRAGFCGSVPTVKRLEAGDGELGGRSEIYVNCERLLKVQESKLLEEVRDLECGSVNELEGPLEKAYWRFTAKDGASLGPWPRMDKIQSTGGAFSVPNRARRPEIGSCK